MAKQQLVGMLSNFEVYEFFKELKENSVKDKEKAHKLKSNSDLSMLTSETLQYFQKTNTTCTVQSKEAIFSFVERMKPYKLTKPEQLTILNCRPGAPVDIQAIVEESEDRLSEIQIEEIIDIIEETLPEPDEIKKTNSTARNEEQEIS